MKKITAVFLILISTLSLAVSVPNLNSAVMKVNDRSMQSRNAELTNAYAQVLSKLTGNVNANTIPQLQLSQAQIQALVESYNYKTQPTPDGQNQLLLQIVFDNNALKQSLQQAQAAIWDADRPQLLVLLQVTNKQAPYIAASDVDDTLTETLEFNALQLGLPIILPTMDLQDQTVFQPSTPFPLTNAQLKLMSDRYGVQSELVGRLYRQPDNTFKSDWVLQFAGASYQWQIEGGTIDAIIHGILADVAGTMSDQLATAQNAGSDHTVRVTVEGVSNIQGMATVIARLKSLPPVNRVEVSKMDQDNLVLTLTTPASSDSIAALIKRTRLHFNQSTPNPLLPADLTFSWVG